MVVKGHRQRQAEATKEQIAAAARGLFASRGYVATTITAIAEAADIPAPTIYSAFGTKAKILSDIAWRCVSTLDVDRQHELARNDPDPARGLRLAANIQRRQYEVMYDVIDICQEAARADEAIAAEVSRILGNRERTFRLHLETIEPHLQSTVDEALAVYLTLVLPEVYRTLVLERGWSLDKYEDWLATTMIRALVDDAEQGTDGLRGDTGHARRRQVGDR